MCIFSKADEMKVLQVSGVFMVFSSWLFPEKVREWVNLPSLLAILRALIAVGWTVVVMRHHGNSSAVDHFAERAQVRIHIRWGEDV